MKRNDYLNDSHVKRFLEWMGPHLHPESKLAHGYALPGSAQLHFANLADAYERYDWDFSFLRLDGSRCAGRTFAENAAVLDELQGRLRGALDAQLDAAARDRAARDAAVEVMRWGGVVPHNVPWLHANEHGLAASLARVRAALECDDDAADLGSDLRFNAGMTKVYSLLLDHFVIYDSRVAAALAWFVARWAREQKLEAVPAMLTFPCMPAKEDARTARRRKVRNPWTGKSGFPLLGSRPYAHAKWNLRASWIIRALLETHPGTVFGVGTAACRRLEAALFMWGYDLTPPPTSGADPLALRAA